MLAEGTNVNEPSIPLNMLLNLSLNIPLHNRGIPMSYLKPAIAILLFFSLAACSPAPNEVTTTQSVSEAEERTALAEASGLFQPVVDRELLD